MRSPQRLRLWSLSAASRRWIKPAKTTSKGVYFRRTYCRGSSRQGVVKTEMAFGWPQPTAVANSPRDRGASQGSRWPLLLARHEPIAAQTTIAESLSLSLGRLGNSVIQYEWNEARKPMSIVACDIHS